MTLSTAQIAAQLDALLTHDAPSLAVAIRCPSRQPWPEVMTRAGRAFTLRWCDSMLAMREALVERDLASGQDAGLVLITPLATHQLAEDVVARLTRTRVFEPEGWEIVRQLFKAKEVDARLARFAWMPQLLVDAAAQGSYAPVGNGFIDLETAWKEVLYRCLQLATARPDAVALLQWSMQPAADPALGLLPEPARPDVLRWLRESGGRVGALVLACVASGHTVDALPLGLVCGVVFAPDGEGEAALGHAAIRLERYVGEAHVGVQEGRDWARAARQLVTSPDARVSRAALERADALLSELRITEFAHLSDVLPVGLDQRLRVFAETLQGHLTAPSEVSLKGVEEQTDKVLAHVLMAAQPQRRDRLVMARRLVRWWSRPAVSVASVEEALTWQADEGAFVDWARFRLLGGDELPELSQAYARLRSAVSHRRAGVASRFASLLPAWNAAAPRAVCRLVPVDAVLDTVVAPLAAQHPVMLLVVDGLSVSIFRELFEHLDQLGWVEMVPAAQGKALVGAAAFPTVTETSRTSLLCGRLVAGASSQEKPGFAGHQALLKHSEAKLPPVLFHKGELADETNLAPEVREALANPRRKVVGVVYNAVDDHLSGPDQLHQRWNLADLRLLLPLLHEARQARRVVVVTADHGHLLEDGTTQVAGGESDRWRLGAEARSDSEVALRGGRVITVSADQAVVCLWGEGSRYGGRKNGYHGGVSPQEVAVPLSVLAPFNAAVDGWTPALPAQPEWWELPLETRAEPVSTAPPARPPRAASRRAAAPLAAPAQSLLFDAEPAPVVSPGRVASADWVGALLSSPIYASQRQLAARVALPDESMRRLLEALAERGGKLSKVALAQRMAWRESGLGGSLSAVRRVLNVDQADVLRVDEAAGTVELNRALLLQQFGIEGQGGSA